MAGHAREGTAEVFVQGALEHGLMHLVNLHRSGGEESVDSATVYAPGRYVLETRAIDAEREFSVTATSSSAP